MINYRNSIADSSSSSSVLLHRGTKRNRAAQILTDSQSSSMAIETHLTDPTLQSLSISLDPTLQSLSISLDPISFLTSQNLTHNVILPTSEEKDVAFQRGRNYDAYSVLRENKLRDRIRKYHHHQYRLEHQDHVSQIPLPPPPKKQVKFQVTVKEKPRGQSISLSSSILAQSVPDFSSMLRKENRKPPTMTLTPPGKSIHKGTATNLSGSKSASSVNEKKKGFLTRKSYASLEELKGFSKGVGNAIMGESRGGGRSGKTILGSRQF